MRVLVTGGTGFLGRAVVRALISRGHAPVVFARSAGRLGQSDRGDGEIEAIGGDVRSPDQLVRASRGCDAICHTAALVTVWRPRRADFDDVNVGGLENVLAVAREQHLRVVYTSSFLATPPRGSNEPVQLNDYQRTKVIADGVARRRAAEGAEIVIVYPGVIYGPGPLTEGNLLGRMIADHLAGKLPGLIGADRIWSYSFVEDVAEGHVAALEKGAAGGRYPLGGENATQMRPFEIVRHSRGGRLPRRIPFAAAAALGAVEQLRSKLFGKPPLLTVGTAKILEHDWPVDSSLAGRELGYHPRGLEEGMRSVLEDLQDRRADTE